MISTIAWAIAGFVAFLFTVAAFRPATFTVTRSAVIETPQARLFGIVSDLANFDAWSPWSRLDTAMKKTFSDETSGIGASYAWDGNGDVGAGKLTIVDLSPDDSVTLDLDFLRPFKAKNSVVFALKAEEGGTRMTWTMHGPLPIFARLMHMFVNMDKMVGGQFEEGLGNLKALAETNPGGDLPGIVV